MRTNIVIDDALMVAAMKAGNFTTKRETVEAGVRLLARRRVYAEIRALRGKLQWEGDLNEMRVPRSRRNEWSRIRA
jgi:Arc/MetJ family transcription regulator